MKKLILLCVVAMSFMSCEKDEMISTQEDATTAKLLGEWQMYKDENLESVIDQWTGTEWTMRDQWYQNTREDSQIILEFKEDGTVINRYGDVETANGMWTQINENRYSFDFIQEGVINEFLSGKRFLTFYCDNTYSIEIEGNDRAIYYYKAIGTTECSDLITYNVE